MTNTNAAAEAAANAQPSTLQSIVDSASATVHSVIGAITGNAAETQTASDLHTISSAEKSASHAGASVGPFNFSASGATVSNSDRTEGKKDQLVGSGKEFVGNALGSPSLTSEGQRQNAEGQGQEAAGQVKDYVGGAVDRVTGAVGAAVAGVTGNEGAKSSYQTQHDTGKTNVRGVEADLSHK